MLKSLIKDVMVYGLGSFIFKFIAYFSFIIYANIFSVGEFGVMSLVNSLASIVALFIGLGLNNAIQRFYLDTKEVPEEKRPVLVSTGLAIIFVWAVVLTIILLAAAYPLSGYMEERYSIPWPFIVLSLLANIPAFILGYSSDVLRLYFSPWKFTFLSSLTSLLGIFIGFYMIILLNMGLIGFFAGGLLGSIIAVPVGLWLIRRDLTLSFDWSIARKVLSFGYPFIFMGLAYWVYDSLNRWLLASLSSTLEVGLYNIAFKFASIITLGVTAFGMAWAPFALRTYAQNPDYPSIFSRIFSYWFYALVIAGTFISLFGADVLRISTPKEYWHAAPVIGPVTMGAVMMGTTVITALGISLAKRTHLLNLASWIAAAVNLITNILLIPRFGALGASLATFISYTVLTGYYLYWSQRLEPFPLEKGKLFYSIFTMTSAMIVSMYINTFEWSMEMFIIKLLFCGAVILGGFLTGVVKISEIRKLIPGGA